MADWVIVSVHCHESGTHRDEPPAFLEAFARAAIDEGADMFFGHGPHVTRGIEIYKGKPILYSLGKIHIGQRSIISQFAHLCAGTHDHTDHTFKLIRSPVTIGDDVWIGADAFIGPGVKVGSLSVVGARSSTYKDLPAQQVFVGNPAKPIKDRVLQ